MLSFILINKKNIALCVVLIAAILGVRSLPIQYLSDEFQTPIGEQIRYIILNVLCILICLLLIKKLKLQAYAGVSNGHVRNYWMLFLPLVFPGVLFVDSIDNNCFSLNRATLAIWLNVLIGGCFEELLFRGAIQGYLASRKGPYALHKVCMTTAILFGLIHLVNLRHSPVPDVMAQVVFAFFMSMIFSALMVRVGNIWALGIVHGIINMISTPCTEQTVMEQVAGRSVGQSITPPLAMFVLMLPALLIYWLLMKTNPGDGGSHDQAR